MPYTYIFCSKICSYQEKDVILHFDMELTDTHIIYSVLTPKMLKNLLQLQEEAFAHISDESLLRRNSEAMFLECLQPPHTTLGAFLDNKLIAIAILYNPLHHPEEALSPLLQTINGNKYEAANFKLCIVHPDYRGIHLQQILGKQLETYAIQQHISLLCSTASPNNYHSIHNLLAIGYQFDHALTKYSFNRNLYYKLLSK